VHDIEGGIVNDDTAQSLIILSMIIPVVAGGIAWEISNYIDAYRNRKKYDNYVVIINELDNKLELLKEKENGFFQEKTNGYWNTYNIIKGFKEYYNKKKSQETAALSEPQKYATDYDGFYLEALKRYDKHKDKQDALERMKIDSGHSDVGEKIG
jgi:hypothetical protein